MPCLSGQRPHAAHGSAETEARQGHTAQNPHPPCPDLGVPQRAISPTRSRLGDLDHSCDGTRPQATIKPSFSRETILRVSEQPKLTSMPRLVCHHQSTASWSEPEPYLAATLAT